MQMIPLGAIPGVEHPDHAKRAADPFRIAGERLEGVGRGVKQQVVDELLMRAGAGVQGVREGAGHEEIGDGQQVVQLPVAPAVGAVGFTRGAMAMGAGVVAIVVCPALGTIVACPTHHRRAAVFDSPHCLRVAGEHPLAVPGAIGWAVFPEDVREFEHGKLETGSWLQTLHQAGNRLKGLRFGGHGEMGVGRGGFGGVVAEILLNEAQIDARFQEMGGIGVPKLMDMGVLRDPGLLERRAKGHLHTTSAL